MTRGVVSRAFRILCCSLFVLVAMAQAQPGSAAADPTATATTGPVDAGTLNPTSAILTGTVDATNTPYPGGLWWFNFCDDASWRQSQCYGDTPSHGFNDHATTRVSAGVDGLNPGTLYHYQLIAATWNYGTSYGAWLTFTTPGQGSSGTGSDTGTPCPGVKIDPTGKPPGSPSDKLKQLIDKTYVISQRIADVGPLDIAGYARLGLADASLCSDNVVVEDLKPFSSGLAGLTVLADTPQLNPMRRNFALDLLKGWNYSSGSGDWLLAPYNQPFSLDWHDVHVTPKQDLKYDDNKDQPAVTDDILNVTSPTLTTRLIDVPRLYLSAALQAQSTFGVALSPGQVKLACEIETSEVPLPFLTDPQFIPFQKAAQFQKALQDHFPDILKQFPQLYSAIDISAAIAAFAGTDMVGPACADGVATVEAAPVVIVVVAVVVVTAAVGAAIAKLGSPIGNIAFAGHQRVTIPRAGPLVALPATRAVVKSKRGLQSAPVTRSDVAPFVREMQLLPASANVRKLVVSSSRLRPRGTILALGAGLPDGPPHRATIVMRGPGYSAARTVAESHGIAGARIRLPAHMAAGLWAIAIIDDSNLRPGPNYTTTGSSEVRLGVFRVNRARRRSH